MRSDLRHVLIRPAAAWLALVLLVSGCSGSGGGSDNETATDETTPGSPAATVVATGPLETATMTADVDLATPTPFMRPTSIARPTEPPWPPAIEAAISAAASEFRLDRDKIDVMSFEERRWPSTALGCPEPGRSYAQILVDGYRVILDIDGRMIVYHTDGSGDAIVQCDEGNAGER